METLFTVTNKNADLTKGNSILVFVKPVQKAENWVYAAWQQLNPTSGGGSQKFTLSNKVSAQATIPEEHHYESNAVVLPQQKYSNITKPPGGNIELSSPQDGSQWLEPKQAGLLNTVAEGGIFAQWLVNGSLAIQGNTELSNQGKSIFELDTTLYFTVGQYVAGPNWQYNQIAAFKTYSLPPQTSTVNVTLTYNVETATYTWTFDPPSD